MSVFEVILPHLFGSAHARSSAQTAQFVLLMRPQGKSRESANSNPPYLLQQSQTSLHAPRQADPNIDQRKHAETRKHQPTHTNPKKPDPSLCTAHKTVGGLALKPCRPPRHFAATFRICNSARSSNESKRGPFVPVRPHKTALFVLVIRPQGKSRESANSNPPYLLQQLQSSLHAPKQADPQY
jgi:hypothetical protein